jgi:hypothetical protein
MRDLEQELEQEHHRELISAVRQYLDRTEDTDYGASLTEMRKLVARQPWTTR